MTAATHHTAPERLRQAQFRLVLALAHEPPDAVIWDIERALDEAPEMVAAGQILLAALEVAR
jgi:hypothetical protein